MTLRRSPVPARRTLLAVLLVLPACAPSFELPLPGPERERGALDDQEVDAIAEVLRLEDHRTFDESALRRLALHPSLEVRRRAVTAAGRIGDPAATPLLTGVLARDREPAVRADAAFALGELGDTSVAVIQALRAAAPPGWVPVRDAETTVVVEVVGALGKLGTGRAADLVTDVLRAVYPARDRHTRRIASEALLAAWRFGEGPGRAVSLAPYLDSPDPELRWRAAYAFMRLGTPAGTRRLLSRMRDEEHRVRAYAARGLSASLADSAGVREAALAALDSAAADPHPHVRINALGALAGYGEAAPIGTVAARLRDPDPHVGVAAAAALGRLGARAADTLAAVAAQAAIPMPVRAAAARALAGLDGARALTVLEPWSRAGDFASRYAAAGALAAIGWQAGRETLERLTRDPDARVAVAAIVAAGEIAADTTLPAEARDRVRDLLLELAGAPDPRRSAPALAAVGPLLRPQDLGTVLNLYAALPADSAARAAAIAAIGALGTLRRLEPAAAERFFDRFAAPPDRWIQRAAADTLGAGWGASPDAAAEGPVFYREVVRRWVAPVLAGQRRPRAEIRTAGGSLTIELHPEEAPLTVHNFAALARAGYFDNGLWHRVVPNFVLQDGAPAGWPDGGPGLVIRDEINRLRYGRGTLGMALSGPDTGGSQWFLTHSPQPHLDGAYTVFGRVVDGMEVADRVVQGDPIQTIRIR